MTLRPEEFGELSLAELDRSMGTLASRMLRLEEDVARLASNYEVVYGVLKKLVGK